MKNNDFPLLKTERLILRQLTTSDADMVLYLRSDTEITKYIKRKKPKNLDDALVFINSTNHKIKNHELIYWCIRTKENSEMIGAICLWNFSENRKIAEVGYELNPKFQKNGLMSEAMNCILKFGFKQLNFDRIEAFTHKNNESSKKMLLNNNFHYVSNRTDIDNVNNIIFEVEK